MTSSLFPSITQISKIAVNHNFWPILIILDGNESWWPKFYEKYFCILMGGLWRHKTTSLFYENSVTLMMLMTSYRVYLWFLHNFFSIFWKVHFNTVILVYRLSKSIEKQQSYGVFKFWSRYDVINDVYDVISDVMTWNNFFLKSTNQARHFGVWMVSIGSEITEI